MTTAAIPSSSSAPVIITPRRLRLWPGVLLAAGLWIFFEALPRFELDNRVYLFYMQWGAMGLIGGFIAWWLFFSRAPWLDRVGVLLLCVGAGAAVRPLVHPSANDYVALMYVAYAIPVVMAAWVIWLLATPFLRWPARRIGLWVTVGLCWIYPTMLRLDGATSDVKVTVNYRWVPTPEERFLADPTAQTKAGSQSMHEVALTVAQPGDWPGFRGLERDGRRPGVEITTDWKEHPPRLVWRHRVGPGWGSFSVVGKRIFTQEQHGAMEAVVCYDADTGKEIWTHEDKERFYESVAGPGPRGTPTFHDGKLYTLGATGRLNCLDAHTGQTQWSKNIVDDSSAKTQHWGFTASPVVSQGIVTVFAGGPSGKSVLGYQATTGDLAWARGEGENSYSSTQLARLRGVEQILMATDAGLTSFDPVTGNILWNYHKTNATGERPPANGSPIAQPAVLNDSEVLFGTTEGTSRLLISHEGNEWSTKEVWHSMAIKPYFNDMVIYKGHIYGFDGSSVILFTCINLEDGKMKWKERGYGGGQVLLIQDQGLLVILTEKNEVALVEASPEKRKELCRVPLLQGIKSWSHPVVAHGKLFIRNDEEAACYDVGEIQTAAR